MVTFTTLITLLSILLFSFNVNFLIFTGKLSLEGCIELAYFTGLIKYHNGRLASSGKHYIGWLDNETGAPISDLSIKSTYEEQILKHSGIRILEPKLFEGYNPNKKSFLHEISIEHDLGK